MSPQKRRVLRRLLVVATVLAAAAVVVSVVAGDGVLRAGGALAVLVAAWVGYLSADREEQQGDRTDRQD